MSYDVERTLTGRLAGAYPASEHDVELRVDGVPAGELRDVLRQKSDEILDSDRECRKVVYAASVGDLAAIAAAEAAGFRYVVDVDIADDESGTLELSLLVREPDHVTRVDMNLEDVPEH